LKNFGLNEAQDFVYAAKRTQFDWSKFEKPINIEKVCSIKNLFIDFSFKEEEKRKYLELFFDKTVEKNFSKIINKIRSLPFFVLNKEIFNRREIFSFEEEENLIKFLSLQIIRSPKWLHRIKENEVNRDKKSKKIIKKMTKGLNKEKRIKVETTLMHQAFLRLINISTNGERVHEKVIREYDWCLEINLTQTPFLTSDDPVINFEEGYGYLFCPLSKIYGIYIGLKNSIKQKVIVQFCDEDMVNAWNYFQVKRAYANNYHFSTVISDDKDLIKKYLKKTETDPHIIKLA